MKGQLAVSQLHKLNWTCCHIDEWEYKPRSEEQKDSMLTTEHLWRKVILQRDKVGFEPLLAAVEGWWVTARLICSSRLTFGVVQRLIYGNWKTLLWTSSWLASLVPESAILFLKLHHHLTLTFFCLATIASPKHGHRPPTEHAAIAWGPQMSSFFVIPSKYKRQSPKEKCSSPAPASSVTCIWESLA